MKVPGPFLYQLMGVIVNGDFGPYTMYTSQRKRFVIFPKTWPKEKATYNQTLNRQRWTQAAQRWRNLPDETKADWSALARKAHATVTGYNLYLVYILNHDVAAIATLERQTGVSVRNATGPPLPRPLQA